MYEYSTQTKQVLENIKKYQPIRPSELATILKISNKTIYKHLSKLLDDGQIIKSGETPTVFYSENKEDTLVFDIKNSEDYLIDQNYIYVSPSGDIYRGLNGFHKWCEKNNFDITKEKENFIKKLKQVNKIKKDDLISGKKIILSGKKNIELDEIFYSNFYNLDYFGKTKLGQLVYLGKSGQNKSLIAEIAQIIKPALETLIEKHNIKLVCFIPPTIDRKVQFLDILKKRLNLDLKEVKVTKVPGNKIPQKTLRKLEDRIENAKNTIAVKPTQVIDGNVLIIDDATGSGATLNETAKKIRLISNSKIKIIGYSVVGSTKGFDVISEV